MDSIKILLLEKFSISNSSENVIKNQKQKTDLMRKLYFSIITGNFKSLILLTVL